MGRLVAGRHAAAAARLVVRGVPGSAAGAGRYRRAVTSDGRGIVVPF
jgi:hypothetical protein